MGALERREIAKIHHRHSTARRIGRKERAKPAVDLTHPSDLSGGIDVGGLTVVLARNQIPQIRDRVSWCGMRQATAKGEKQKRKTGGEFHKSAAFSRHGCQVAKADITPRVYLRDGGKSNAAVTYFCQD